MNGASKILTVSYGTFSCTLEGFDDSFDTMKEIAEYFRDLAADDRYFGAEPPTLDAEMLAKIASRGMTRQVEAKVGETGVVLRPSEQSGSAEADSEEVQAKSGETHTDIPKPDEQAATAESAESVVVPSNEYDDAQDEALAVSASRPENADAEEDNTAGNESVAAKLRRIRAVVASKQAANPTTSIFASNDEPEAEKEEENAESNESEPEDNDEPLTPENLLADANEILGEGTGPGTTEGIAETGQDSEMIGYDVSLASVLEAVEDEEDIEDGSLTNVFADEAEGAEKNIEDISEHADGANTSDVDEEGTPPVRPTPARLLKTHKDESEHEDTGEPDNDDSIKDALQGILGNASRSANDTTDMAPEPANDDKSHAVEEDNKPSLRQGIGAALRADRANRVMQTEIGAQDEAAVSRLLEETNAKLDTRESIRKRSAISHLRAAVAATFADRKLDLGDEDTTADEAEAYRTDLADVVQPHGIETPDTDPQNDPAPLVLVSEQRIDEDGEIAVDLGSIQTESDIDLSLDEDAGLKTLIQARSLNETSHDDQGFIAGSTSFAEFAGKMGATELPDLLEAAAAYIAFVEGQPHFGRPQVMRQVADFAGKGEFSREEGLRSFGQLLRQGKIVKVRRGQFEISETTRFKPEALVAGE